MKILHATEIDIGGTATVVNLLMRSQLSDKTITFCMCVAPEKIVGALDSNSANNLSTFKRSGRNVRSLTDFTATLIKAVWQEKPDIVHLHSTFAGIIGRLALTIIKPFRRPKIIYCPHGFSFLMEGSIVKKKIFSAIEIILSLTTDKIICVSEYEKNAGIAAGIPSNKIKVIYNGTPPINDNVKQTTSPYPASHSTKINYLFAGRFDQAKGFDILLSAIKKKNNNHAHFTVAGISADEVSSNDPPSNITYLGWVNSKDLAPYFAHADALVLPSRWEGFPMVVLEAMSMGIPVIASDCTSLPEAVDHNVTGVLFSTCNSDELSDVISNISLESLRIMGENGRERFTMRFTSERMTRLTLDLYSEILFSNSNVHSGDIT